MWLLACSVGVPWDSVQRGKLARIRSGSVYGVLWGVCSGCGYLSMYAAIQGAARLVVAPGAMAPAGFCILSAFQIGSARRGLSLGSSARFLLFQSGDGFGDPRRRSRSVGASASAPGSVARSSADVLTAPDTRSGCPSVVDMARGLLVYVFGWRRLHVLRIVTA